MLDCSRRTLVILAAMVWYSGTVVLSYKSSTLLIDASDMNPDPSWIWFTVIAGILIGWLKARYLFKRICIKNLKRIESLVSPQLWQFYRTGFYFFLLAMIMLGSTASSMAYGHYSAMITIATIEVSLATALLASSSCFWQKN